MTPMSNFPLKKKNKNKILSPTVSAVKAQLGVVTPLSLTRKLSGPLVSPVQPSPLCLLEWPPLPPGPG